MDNKFIDPPNLDYFLDKLKTLDTQESIHKFIENSLPGWLHYTFDEYCSDYPTLTKNWNIICDMIKTKPAKIVLVNWISNDDDHKLVTAFCETMTKYGFMIRRTDEFQPCIKCGKAIPDKLIWEKLQELKIPSPKTWSQKCSTC